MEQPTDFVPKNKTETAIEQRHYQYIGTKSEMAHADAFERLPYGWHPDNFYLPSRPDVHLGTAILYSDLSQQEQTAFDQYEEKGIKLSVRGKEDPILQCEKIRQHISGTHSILKASPLDSSKKTLLEDYSLWKNREEKLPLINIEGNEKSDRLVLVCGIDEKLYQIYDNEGIKHVSANVETKKVTWYLLPQSKLGVIVAADEKVKNKNYYHFCKIDFPFFDDIEKAYQDLNNLPFHEEVTYESVYDQLRELQGQDKKYLIHDAARRLSQVKTAEQLSKENEINSFINHYCSIVKSTKANSECNLNFDDNIKFIINKLSECDNLTSFAKCKSILTAMLGDSFFCDERDLKNAVKFNDEIYGQYQTNLANFEKPVPTTGRTVSSHPGFSDIFQVVPSRTSQTTQVSVVETAEILKYK